MNKYSDKSDFEINKAVSYHYLKGKNFSETTCRFISDHVNDKFDPCNDPSDAMLIIIDNKIPMKPHSYKLGAWECGGTGLYSSIHKNPYRAAMEVFLMMKDAENEKI